MRLPLAVFAALLASTAVSSAQPQQILADCRRMLPERPVTLKGAIIMRSRKGIPQGEYGYTLTADRTKTPATIDVAFTPRGETNVLERAQLRRPGDIPEGRILKTDVTWLDLTLDFLWWPTAEFEAEREGETIHGQKCTIILARPAKPVARVKKFGERWMANVLEVETLGSGHRTKIIVESIEDA